MRNDWVRCWKYKSKDSSCPHWGDAGLNMIVGIWFKQSCGNGMTDIVSRVCLMNH